MKDRRLTKNGQLLNFTFENTAFKTNINKGYSFEKRRVKGSAIQTPLYKDKVSSDSLWLEHVLDKRTNGECFWLMWYDVSLYYTPSC